MSLYLPCRLYKVGIELLGQLKIHLIPINLYLSQICWIFYQYFDCLISMSGRSVQERVFILVVKSETQCIGRPIHLSTACSCHLCPTLSSSFFFCLEIRVFPYVCWARIRSRGCVRNFLPSGTKSVLTFQPYQRNCLCPDLTNIEAQSYVCLLYTSDAADE